MAAGEFPVSAGVYGYSVEDLKTRGDPVDCIGLEPVISCTVAVALPSQPPIRIPQNFLSNGCYQRRVRSLSTSTAGAIRDDVDSKYGKILKPHKLLMTDVDPDQKEAGVTTHFENYSSEKPIELT